MRIQYFFIPACLIFLTLCAKAEHAKSKQLTPTDTHQKVLQGAANFVRTSLQAGDTIDLRIQTTELDSRIVVPDCESSFSFSASQESLRQSNVTVRAACPDNNWYLYLTVKTQRIQQVVVAANAISPGTLLTFDNLVQKEMDKNQIRTSTFATTENLIGARLKRRVRPGQPITPNLLCFICKGDNITISANLKGLSIRTKGVAQQDGNIGETIWVKNVNSDKMVHARVKNNLEVMVSI